MKKNIAYLSIFVVTLLVGCAGGSKMSKSAAAYNDYEENLSPYRRTYPDLPKAESLAPSTSGPVSAEAGDPVDSDLQVSLTKFADSNANREVYNGFTILVYSGVDRDQAFSTRNELYNTLPSQVKAEMEYDQPRYLVKVGRYINRIEAQSLFHTIKQDFPSARIIQQRFGKEEEDGEVEEIEDTK
ncbi:hypothetical protein DN752_13325 [Echinicola strongylocentroti]|uniref:SPOR domain-containing protein n=1 Tax=Echinicola strongylocentroti TaxID=1795355 RepID=A0A2Z4IJE1_9BACT|nr:hypothetical protein [Echinicola strongylocentroti]AWW31025.1 hypothetical protein DN752_13325 [Echinicola strongylocentroti]